MFGLLPWPAKSATFSIIMSLQHPACPPSYIPSLYLRRVVPHKVLSPVEDASEVCRERMKEKGPVLSHPPPSPVPAAAAQIVSK